MAKFAPELMSAWTIAQHEDNYDWYIQAFRLMTDEMLRGHETKDDLFSYSPNKKAAFQFVKDERRKKRAEEQEQQRAAENRQATNQQHKDTLPYSDKLAQEICERIATGELLINVCELDHLPTLRRCNQWLRDDSAFNQLYKSALDDRLSIFEEQVIQIADDMKRDFKTVIKNGREQRVADPEMVARAKLRIEVRFRHLKAGRPSKWGDVSTLVTKSADDDLASMSDAELERHIAEMEAKDRSVKGSPGDLFGKRVA